MKSKKINFNLCPMCGRTASTANLRTIIRRNQMHGFKMALEAINQTWGILIQNLSAELELTEEQTQKLSRIGEYYFGLMGNFVKEGMAADDFAEYMVEKSKQIVEELKTR